MTPEEIERRKKNLREEINKTPKNETQTVALVSRGLKTELETKKLNPPEYKELRDFVVKEMGKAKYSEASIKLFERFTPLPITA